MPAPAYSLQTRHLGKCFAIYARPEDRLKQALALRAGRLRSRLARAVGRGESPAPARYYREFWALRDVSLRIDRGESVGIIGRNGAGKSTLLQIIAGTQVPTTGQVEVTGRVAALLELGAGFNPEFTGRENVQLNAALLGLSRSDIAERMESILAFADIGSFVDQPVKTYSSGMYARLAFSVASHVDPDVLIVDEALSVGDIRFQNKCLRRMSEFVANGVTVILVTHSVDMVKSFCSRAIWLHDGQIVRDGEPADLARAYVNFMVHGIRDDAGPATPLPSPPSPVAERHGPAGAVSAPWHEVGPEHAVAGSGEARFERVRFYRARNGEPLHTIEDGDFDVVCEAVVSVGRAVAQPLFGVGLFNHLNEPVLHCNSANLGLALQPMEPGARVLLRCSFRLPTLRLGNYLLALGLDDGVPGQNEVLCHVYDAVELVRARRAGEAHAQAGYVEMPGAAMTVSPMAGAR